MCTILLSSCSLDPVSEVGETPVSSQGLIAQSAALNLVENQNGILYFVDRDHLNSVLAEIEQIESNWEEEATPSEDLYVIPSEALDAVEANYSFSSLRKEIELQEAIFLASGGTPFSVNPNFTHPIGDEYWRTILNPYSEFGIGDTIFKFIDDYSVLIMNNITPTDLDLIRSNVNNVGDVIDLQTPSSPEARIFLNHGGRIDNIPLILGGVTIGPSVENNCSQTTTLQALEIDLEAVANENEAIITTNAGNILPTSSSNQFDGYRITFRNLNVPNSPVTPASNGSFGPLNSETIEFPGPGRYEVCMRVEVSGSQSGPNCFLEDCEIITVSGCCDEREVENNGDGTIYGPNNENKFFAEVKLVNNLFSHRIKLRTIHYERRPNDDWRQGRADRLEHSLINSNSALANGVSRIYTPNQTNRCGVEWTPDVATESEEEQFNRRRISSSFNPVGIRRFFIQENTILSVHVATQDGISQGWQLLMTDDCE